MTDVIAPPESVPEPQKKKGGWPRGKLRPRKAAPVEREVRASPVKRVLPNISMRFGANWETNDASVVDGVDRLHIPKGDIPEGMDLMWMTDSVYGQPFPDVRAAAERKGWTPVHPADFNGKFDGRFTPKGHDGEINFGGLVLVARPLYLSEQSRARELQAARNQVTIKERALRGGDIPGVRDADHPTALRSNRVSKSVEPISIPGDE